MTSKTVFVFAAASTMSLGAIAQTVITVPVAPPAHIVQTVPAAPPGYVWAPPYWTQRPDGSWAVAGGAFVPRHEAQILGAGRDRDRDGTPDQLDADKDNDGVPNRYDSHPNNRYRD